MQYDSKEQKALVLGALNAVTIKGDGAEQFVKLKKELMDGPVVEPKKKKDK